MKKVGDIEQDWGLLKKNWRRLIGVGMEKIRKDVGGLEKKTWKDRIGFIEGLGRIRDRNKIWKIGKDWRGL